MLLEYDEVDKVIQKVYSDPSFKAAVGRTETRVFYMQENLQNTKCRNRIKSSKNVVVAVPCVIYSKKDFYLLGELNNKLRRMIAAGLINFWYTRELHPKETDRKENISPKTMTLHNFKGGFYILAFGLIMSYTAFVSEFVYSIISG